MIEEPVRRVKKRNWLSEVTPRYGAVCDDCKWQCHTMPHKSAGVAQRCLERHTLYKHVDRADWQPGGAQ